MSETVRATSRGTYHPLLGTNVEVRVVGQGATLEAAYVVAAEAEAAVVAEMERLQKVFTVFDPESELCRWRSGREDATSAELAGVLAAAQHWWQVSGGAFHPAAGVVRRRWLRAEAEQRLPSAAELDALAAALAVLPFRVEGTLVRRSGDCAGVDLNAIAKGYIVDRGVAAGLRDGVCDVLVNAGGDLRHVGDEVVRVGVEDPAAVGGSPLAVVTLSDGAVATSGSVHRGFRISEQWYGHVVDPRTARPVPNRPSTTVRAADAITADALATVVGVLAWDEAVGVLAQVPKAAALSVGADGELRSVGHWPQTV